MMRLTVGSLLGQSQWGPPLQEGLPRPLSRAVGFEGDKKKKQQKATQQQFPAALTAAGINAETLKQQWGVTLWTARAKEDALQLKVDISENPSVDVPALTRWFQERLSAFGEVVVKIKSLKSCCFKQCTGCLSGNPQFRKDWIKK
jgi:hypothetical protein